MLKELPPSTFLFESLSIIMDLCGEKEILEMTKSYDFPYIIAAKKQDSPGALGLDEIRKKLKLPEDVVIVPVLEKDNKEEAETLELLINNNIGKILGVFLR
jgi:signal recognition particle receptor subunit beta